MAVELLALPMGSQAAAAPWSRASSYGGRAPIKIQQVPALPLKAASISSLLLPPLSSAAPTTMAEPSATTKCAHWEKDTEEGTRAL